MLYFYSLVLAIEDYFFLLVDLRFWIGGFILLLLSYTDYTVWE